MDWQTLLQFVLSGASTGCIYALVGLGFVLCANATGVINFAAGEYVMVGGLVAARLAGLRAPLPLAVLAAVAAAPRSEYFRSARRSRQSAMRRASSASR